MPTNVWKPMSNFNLNDSTLAAVKDSLESFQGTVQTLYDGVETIFSTIEAGVDSVKSVLSTLSGLGLSPFEDSDNPILILAKQINDAIDSILTAIDLGSLHYLDIFKIQSPYYIQDKDEFNTIRFDELFSKLYFHTIDDKGDLKRPMYQDSAEVGGILLLAHSFDINIFYDMYKKMRDLFSKDAMYNISLGKAIDIATNFPLYTSITNLKFINPDVSSISRFTIWVSGASDNEIMEFGSVDFPGSVFYSNSDPNPDKNTLSFIKLKFTLLNKNTLTIPKNTFLEITAKYNDETKTIISELPEGQFNSGMILYVDENGNLYRDPTLVVPEKLKFKKRTIPKDLESIPPNYETESVKKFFPFLEELYNTILGLKDFIFSSARTIADELQDILDAFDLWLNAIENYLNEIKALLDSIQRISDVFTSATGLYGLFVVGTGVKGMMDAVLSASARPDFKKGFYGGIFIVGIYNDLILGIPKEASPINNLAKLFGLA